ncbi:MAG: cyclic nucleotide-binding domain-containing protein [Alphaproteobacteria bacterium]|nr:cyclic nucleotide-binding domain-containing protein [Alphaproteobacteria bacterium]
MAELIDRLRALPFFEALDDSTTKEIADRGLWFSLAGGWELFAQGGNSQTLFFLLSGRLIVVRSGAAGETVLGYVRSGEPVGEMSLLSGEPHSASVYALRDSEMLALPRADYEEILEKSPDLAVALARAVLGRARHPTASFQQTAPRVFALIGTSPAIDIDARAKLLAREASRYGVKVRAITEAEEETCYVGFEQLESGLDIVLLAAKVGYSSWYQFVLRHADRFFVLARRDARPPRPFPLSPAESSPARRFRLVDLIVVEEGLKTTPVAEWARAVEANRIFHWRSDASLGALARVVAGKSVGLVLSGGGARAYAHLGVIRAMRERGVPIDFIGGASMGAVVGACYAMGWSDAEIESRIRDGFVASNPLGDHVLPVVALTRGGLVEERLRRHFGDALIEDLQTPFFCVSSDLVSGGARVDTLGVLRHSLRASVSLPGILPPVVDGQSLLVDGAVVDNFPTDYMRQVHRGLTIGVDVAARGTIRASDFADPPNFFQWIVRNGFRSPPPIVALLMRAATAREEKMEHAHPADILITPTIEGVDLRDWKRFEPAVAAGYAAARAALEERWDALAPIVEAAKGEDG